MFITFDTTFASSQSITHLLDIAVDCWESAQCLQYSYDTEEEQEEKLYDICRNVVAIVKQAVMFHEELNLDKHMRDNYIEALAKGTTSCSALGIRGYSGVRYLSYAIAEYNERCEAHGDEYYVSPWSDEEVAHIDDYFNFVPMVDEGMSLEDIFSDIESATAKFDAAADAAKKKHEEERGEFVPYFLLGLDAVVEDITSFDEITGHEDIHIYGRFNLWKDDDGEVKSWSSLYISEDVKHGKYAIGEMYAAEDGTVRLPVIIDGTVSPFIVSEVNIKKVRTTDGEVRFIGGITVDEPEAGIIFQ